jgi:FAD/FMN-containing dehydrogenase
VQPRTVEQVQYIVKRANKNDISITIKNGGHSYSGSSTAREGVLLDLKNLTGVKLNIKEMTVTIQAGEQWGSVYRELVRDRVDGFIVSGRRCPTVGVSGFILGGGIGPFTRNIGMGCDSLIEAKVVLADGKLVTVTNTDKPDSPKGKLFWALRGAGGGNFGILFEMKLAVKKLQNEDGLVVDGRFDYIPKPGDSTFVPAMNRFYSTD